jgi:hypothetical protein
MALILRPVLSAIFAALLTLSGLSATAQTTTTPTTGIVADATATVTSHTDVAVGAYILRLSNVSPQNGSFDVDMWLWFRWKGTDVRPDQTFEIVNGVISSRSEAQVVDDGGVNYSTVRVQATIFHAPFPARQPCHHDRA